MEDMCIMKCVQCGKQIADAAKFCGYCGKRNAKVVIAGPKGDSSSATNSTHPANPTLPTSLTLADSTPVVPPRANVCPFCHVGTIVVVQQGYKAGRGIVGGLLIGPVGLAAGAIGANKLRHACTFCGKHW